MSDPVNDRPMLERDLTRCHHHPDRPSTSWGELDTDPVPRRAIGLCYDCARAIDPQTRYPFAHSGRPIFGDEIQVSLVDGQISVVVEVDGQRTVLPLARAAAAQLAGQLALLVEVAGAHVLVSAGAPRTPPPAPSLVADASNRHRDILAFFRWAHLRSPLREVSARFARLAVELDRLGGPEATVAMRKLLEAKDAAVRACLPAATPDATLVAELLADPTTPTL